MAKHRIGFILLIAAGMLIMLSSNLFADSTTIILRCQNMGAGTATVKNLDLTGGEDSHVLTDVHWSWPINPFCNENKSIRFNGLSAEKITDIHFEIDIVWPPGKGKDPETWADGGLWPQTYSKDPDGAIVWIEPPRPIGYNIPWLIITVISLMLAGGYLILRFRKRGKLA